MDSGPSKTLVFRSPILPESEAVKSMGINNRWERNLGNILGSRTRGPKPLIFYPPADPPPDNKNQSRMVAKSDKMNPPNSRLDNFLAVAPKVGKLVSAVSISWLPNFGARNRKNQCLDLLILMPCFQTLTKWILEMSIWWLCGFGSRKRHNQSQDSWFDDFATPVHKSTEWIPEVSV